MVVYFRDKHLSILGEAQHIMTCSLRAQQYLHCPQGRQSLKHCKIIKCFPQYTSLVTHLIKTKSQAYL